MTRRELAKAARDLAETLEQVLEIKIDPQTITMSSALAALEAITGKGTSISIDLRVDNFMEKPRAYFSLYVANEMNAQGPDLFNLVEQYRRRFREKDIEPMTLKQADEHALAMVS